MKFSYNWLKELSGTKKSIEDLSDELDKVVIGEVVIKVYQFMR